MSVASQTEVPTGGARRFLGAIARQVGWGMVQHILAKARTERDVRPVFRRAELLGRIIYSLFRPATEVMMSNMRLAFPEWSKARARLVSAEAIRFFCRGFVDLYRWVVWPELLYQRIKVDGGEHLDALIKQKRGFLLATGHVGVFPFVGIPAVWRGIEYAVMARKLEDMRFFNLLQSWRDGIGLTTILSDPPLASLKSMTRVLRGGGAILYTFDIRPDEHASVEVDFMGLKTRMFSSFVRIAARNRTPLVPCFVIREADGFTHRIVYSPPLEVPPEAAEPGSPAALDVLSALSDWLSRVVTMYPAQWWWVRRRWQDSPRHSAGRSS